VARRGALILVALVACGHRDARTDGSVTQPDGAVTSGTVACGATTCATPAQACCDLPPPSGDICYAVTGGICEGGRMLRCDGPEDCTGQTCCWFGGNSSCATVDACNTEGQAMCHGTDATPCRTSEVCCEVAGTPYSICKPSC